MGIVFRQSAKNAVVVMSGALLGALIIWLSTKYILDKHQFGFIQNLTNNAVVSSQILLFGLNYTLAVYVHKFANDERKRKLLLTFCLTLPAVIACFATIFYFLLRTWVLSHFQPEDMPLMQRYYNWLPIYTLLFIYQLILEQYLGSQMKVALAAFIREVVVRIVNIVVIFLYAFEYIDFNTFVIATVFVTLIPVVSFFIISSGTKAFGLSLDFKSYTRAEYKEMFHFSWYHFLLNMVIILMAGMDMLLLPFYDHKGFGALAVYRVALFFVVILQLPLKALLPASFTVLAKAFADNDLAKAKDIFVRSSLNILIPTIGIALILCCNLQNAVAIIQNGYGEIVPIFLILFIGRIMDSATGMNDQVLSITNYYKFNFYLSLILTITLFVLLRGLIPRYGIYGAAWSTTTTIIIFNIAKYLFVWKKLGMQPFSKSTLLVFVAALPALAAGYFFPYLFNPVRHIYIHTFMDAAMRTAAIAIVYVVMLLWLKPSRDLVEYMASIKKNKRLF